MEKSIPVLLVYIYMTYDGDLVNDVTHNLCINRCKTLTSVDFITK